MLTLDIILCGMLAENENHDGDTSQGWEGNTHLRMRLRSQRKDQRGHSLTGSRLKIFQFPTALANGRDTPTLHLGSGNAYYRLCSHCLRPEGSICEQESQGLVRSQRVSRQGGRGKNEIKISEGSNRFLAGTSRRVAIFREHRRHPNLIIHAETDKPAIEQIVMQLFHQLALRADAVERLQQKRS